MTMTLGDDADSNHDHTIDGKGWTSRTRWKRRLAAATLDTGIEYRSVVAEG
jgi:hypothetical protein